MIQIKFGSIVKDRVTGFKGMVVARVEYFNGCIQYGIRPKMKKGETGKRPDVEYIDEQHLEVIKSGRKTKQKEIGGEYTPDAPKLPINQIVNGDALFVMKSWPANSIDMCITSPPYWGLRDYGAEQIFGGDKDCEHEWGKGIEKAIYSDKYARGYFCLKCHAWKGQLGLEPTPEMYIKHLTDAFNEVKRVLKKEGALWLNIGDTYSATRWSDTPSSTGISKSYSDIVLQKKTNLPPKCLCMIPERLSWSLIQDGWILRNKIIWYKPNGMPASVSDRFSNKWEYIFLFSKNNKTILWRHEKTKEWIKKKPLGTSGIEGIDWYWDEELQKKISLWQGFTYYFDLDAVRENHSRNWNEENWAQKKEFGQKYMQSYIPKYGECKTHRGNKTLAETFNPLGKNPGDIFEINTQPFPEAHFAVFPEKLCEKPIKAGCPEDGIVLDPFCGAGTALYVAKEMRRRYIGIDIKKEYCDMAEERLAQGVL